MTLLKTYEPEKSISVKSQELEVAATLSKSLDILDLTSRVLAARKFTTESAKLFLEPSLRSGITDPKLLIGANQAAALIKQILENKEKIAITCDFDVDGLSGGAQLIDFLKKANADVKAYVPDRFSDGYGLSTRIIEAAAIDGRTLLICIDFGTKNENEIAFAKEKGLKTIVIDHHYVGEADPKADVFINPNQEGCGFGDKVLCASGIVWHLLIELKRALENTIPNLPDVKNYLDLACLGTICDMVPLVGPNRVIAKRGLELLSVTTRPGIAAIKQTASLKNTVKCSDVGFIIGPRLNAAGRMVHGELVLDLLTSDASETVISLATKLNDLNEERQTTEIKVKNIALKQLEYIAANEGTLHQGIVVWNPEFHTGVVGIVAQRLVEQFYRPSVVLGLDPEHPGTYKGSVRGVKNFSVVKALEACGNNLLKFGGHEAAGGLSLKEDKLSNFRKAFQEECINQLGDLSIKQNIETDTEATIPELSLKSVEELEKFSPFGLGNPTPVFLIKAAKILEVKELKSTHLKVVFSQGGRMLTAMMWRTASHPLARSGVTVDVALKIDTNTFQGVTSLQGNIVAMVQAI